MKRWLPRSLWLLAWSFWLWLGFGLYRELPRELGPVMLALPRNDKGIVEEYALGFLTDSDDVVTTVQSTKGFLVRVRDGRTGVLVREAKAGECLFINMGSVIVGVHYSPRLGFVLHEPHDEGHSAEHPFVTLDLRTGRSINQPHARSEFGAFHPHQPLVLTYELTQGWARDDDGQGQTRRLEPDRVEVVDARTGESVFSWTGSQMSEELRKRCGKPFFSADGTLVMIPAVAEPEKRHSKEICRLEVWNLTRKTLLLSLPGCTCNGPECTSIGGRIACCPTGDENAVEVIVVNSGACVFRREAADEDDDWSSITLTSDGINLFQWSTGALWNVDRQVVVQRIEKGGGGFDNSCPADVLAIWQDWNDWPDWLAPYVESLAPNHSWRDLRTGNLLYRCRQTLPRGEAMVNWAGTRMIDEDGDIRSFPPPLNYPLFALCQTILAFPLILVWVLLRWRRKRKLRLASVQP